MWASAEMVIMNTKENVCSHDHHHMLEPTSLEPILTEERKKETNKLGENLKSSALHWPK